MKSQTKALVASLVVIALALSAVSGITYSWFSDTEKSDITVTTAKVDYEVDFSIPTDAVNGVATLKQVDSTTASFTLSGLAANVTAKIDAEITNNSTVKTVYQVLLTPSYKAPGEGKTGFTQYDFANILVQRASEGTISLFEDLTKKGSWNSPVFDPIVIQDWTVVESTTTELEKVTTVITTPQEYGGTPEEPIVAFGSNGEGKTTKGDGDTDWSAKTERTGLSFTLEVVAVQGDYPYKTMTEVGNTKAVAATLPTNKVVSAAKIESSKTEQTDVVKDVIVDFSNVANYYTTDPSSTTSIAEQKVTVKVDSITADETETTKKTINLTLTLGDGDDASTTKNFDKPVVITMTVPGALSDPKVVYDGAGTNGTVLSSTTNSGSTTTIVFSVDHFSTYTIKQDDGVESEQEFRNAVAAGGEVKLAKNLTLNKHINVSKDTVLDLNGKTLTCENENDVSYAFGIICGAELRVIADGANVVSKETYFVVTFKGTLEVSGGTFSVVSPVMVQSGNQATFSGSTINSTDMAYASVTGSTSKNALTLKDVEMTTTGAACVCGLKNAQVTINGGKYTSTEGAVFITNGTQSGGGQNWNIDGATINVSSDNIQGNKPCGVGIQCHNADTWTISNCVFNVKDGVAISVRGGNTAISNCTFNYDSNSTLGTAKMQYTDVQISVGANHAVAVFYTNGSYGCTAEGTSLTINGQEKTVQHNGTVVYFNIDGTAASS